MDWFDRDFDHPLYFEIYRSKERDAAEEGPALAALLGLPAGTRVLDLPCGWGRLRPAWEAMGWQGRWSRFPWEGTRACLEALLQEGVLLRA